MDWIELFWLGVASVWKKIKRFQFAMFCVVDCHQIALTDFIRWKFEMRKNTEEKLRFIDF